MQAFRKLVAIGVTTAVASVGAVAPMQAQALGKVGKVIAAGAAVGVAHHYWKKHQTNQANQTVQRQQSGNRQASYNGAPAAAPAPASGTSAR